MNEPQPTYEFGPFSPGCHQETVVARRRTRGAGAKGPGYASGAHRASGPRRHQGRTARAGLGWHGRRRGRVDAEHLRPAEGAGRKARRAHVHRHGTRARDIASWRRSEKSQELAHARRNSCPKPARQRRQRSRPRCRDGLLFGGLAALVGGSSSSTSLRPMPAVEAGQPAITALAVLPLDNLSGDPAQEYFADGMTEALIGNLARIRALRVVSRTSVMRFKGAHTLAPGDCAGAERGRHRRRVGAAHRRSRANQRAADSRGDGYASLGA